VLGAEAPGQAVEVLAALEVSGDDMDVGVGDQGGLAAAGRVGTVASRQRLPEAIARLAIRPGAEPRAPVGADRVAVELGGPAIGLPPVDRGGRAPRQHGRLAGEGAEIDHQLVGEQLRGPGAAQVVAHAVEVVLPEIRVVAERVVEVELQPGALRRHADARRDGGDEIRFPVAGGLPRVVGEGLAQLYPGDDPSFLRDGLSGEEGDRDRGGGAGGDPPAGMSEHHA
jgi:hypothetical protein